MRIDAIRVLYNDIPTFHFKRIQWYSEVARYNLFVNVLQKYNITDSKYVLLPEYGCL